MTSDYQTLADAVGEGRDDSPAFVAGHDFDPCDPDDVEIVGDASLRHRYERDSRDVRENQDLHRRVLEPEAERAGLSVTDYLAELDQADRVMRFDD